MLSLSTIMISIAGVFFQMQAVESFVSHPLLSSPHQTTTNNKVLSQLSMADAKNAPSDDNNNGNANKINPSPSSSSRNPSDLSWLRNAMDSSEALMEPDGLVVVETNPGISGFAVDPDRGFVVILVGGGDRATYAVVSPRDTTSVRSAEALTLVQLSGGLDLGTPILPPDMLARLVAVEMETANVRELRSQVKLLRADVTPNPDPPTEEKNKASAPPQSSAPERNASIKVQAPKVLEAVNELPGLNGEATLALVEEGLRMHSDASGKLDRDGFMGLLETLRNKLNTMELSKVQFHLVASLHNNGETKELEIKAPSAVVAVGLALRYKVDVVVSNECQVEGFDVLEIPSRFPNFRPIKQLYEDAKIMDGFIPSMFGKAKAPENDDKM